MPRHAQALRAAPPCPATCCSSSWLRRRRLSMYLITSSRKQAVLERSACGTSLRNRSSLHTMSSNHAHEASARCPKPRAQGPSTSPRHNRLHLPFIDARPAACLRLLVSAGVAAVAGVVPRVRGTCCAFTSLVAVRVRLLVWDGVCRGHQARKARQPAGACPKQLQQRQGFRTSPEQGCWREPKPGQQGCRVQRHYVYQRTRMLAAKKCPQQERIEFAVARGRAA